MSTASLGDTRTPSSRSRGTGDVIAGGETPVPRGGVVFPGMSVLAHMDGGNCSVFAGRLDDGLPWTESNEDVRVTGIIPCWAGAGSFCGDDCGAPGMYGACTNCALFDVY